VEWIDQVGRNGRWWRTICQQLQAPLLVSPHARPCCAGGSLPSTVASVMMGIASVANMVLSLVFVTARSRFDNGGSVDGAVTGCDGVGGGPSPPFPPLPPAHPITNETM